MYIKKRNGKPCKWCGGLSHPSIACWQRPKKPLRTESDKEKEKRLRFRKAWFKANPSNMDGTWDCYLRIASNCELKVTALTIQLEHVYPRSSYKNLKYELLNVKPACVYCNKLKRSQSITKLANTYPHINAMLSSPEWIEWQEKMDQLVANRS